MLIAPPTSVTAKSQAIKKESCESELVTGRDAKQQDKSAYAMSNFSC